MKKLLQRKKTLIAIHLKNGKTFEGFLRGETKDKLMIDRAKLEGVEGELAGLHHIDKREVWFWTTESVAAA